MPVLLKSSQIYKSFYFVIYIQVYTKFPLLWYLEIGIEIIFVQLSYPAPHFLWSTFTCNERTCHLHLLYSQVEILENPAHLYIEVIGDNFHRSEGENVFLISLFLLYTPKAVAKWGFHLEAAVDGLLRRGEGCGRKGRPSVESLNTTRQSGRDFYTYTSSRLPLIPSQHHKLCRSSWWHRERQREE